MMMEVTGDSQPQLPSLSPRSVQDMQEAKKAKKQNCGFENYIRGGAAHS